MPKKLFKVISLVLGILGGVLTLSGISLMLFGVIRSVIEYDSETTEDRINGIERIGLGYQMFAAGGVLLLIVLISEGFERQAESQSSRTRSLKPWTIAPVTHSEVVLAPRIHPNRVDAKEPWIGFVIVNCFIPHISVEEVDINLVPLLEWTPNQIIKFFHSHNKNDLSPDHTSSRFSIYCSNCVSWHGCWFCPFQLNIVAFSENWNHSVQSLMKICETLNITPSEFFNEESSLSSVPTELRSWQRVGEKLSPEQRKSLLGTIETLIDNSTTKGWSTMDQYDTRRLLESINKIERNLEWLRAGQDRQEKILAEILKALQSKKD